MAAANEELALRPAADMDIETVGEDQEQYVEMVRFGSLCARRAPRAAFRAKG